MEKVLIFGHKNPDTDTITSALVYADLKRKLGLDVEPV
ncbi:MAG: DHH family phosphoesterase, partial [Anaerobacillus sp.]